ncbi:hypothetical protein L3Y34_004453 [Caenorhabditis briggsae]|uniref:Uncharacterized protein n=1 Tax=Caenorhabditis briggsae TaxID=6238 RepID=A0AAE9D5T5_CAEBR|nr:hypothetical protein L3Y34_004453 [Caenorhabditis briggsae]
MKHKLCLLLILAIVLSSIADSDSSDDDDKNRDEPSKDDPIDEQDDNTDEEKEGGNGDGSNQDGGTEEALATEAPTSEEKKEGKNKNKTKAEDELSDWDIDKMFGGQANEPKSEDNSTHHTQAPSPSGSGAGSGFSAGTGNSGNVGGGGWLGSLFGSGGLIEPAKEESKDESGGTQGSHGTVGGNSFYPLPRQVDIWDRLFVLAAFPICFFAVLLKAEMFR